MSNLPNQHIANRLKELCKERGITSVDLANQSGVPQRTVYRMMNGGSTLQSVFRMLKICKVLGISVDEFFATEEFEEFKDKDMIL